MWQWVSKWSRRFFFGAALLLLAVCVGRWMVLPWAVNRLLHRALAQAGWPQASFRLVSVNLWHLELADLRPDPSHSVWLARLEADYALPSLIREKRLQHLRLIGLRPQLVWRDGQWDLGPLMQLMKARDSSPAPTTASRSAPVQKWVLPFTQLSIEDSILELDWQGQLLTLPLGLWLNQRPGGQWVIAACSESAIPVRLQATFQMPLADRLTIYPLTCRLDLAGKTWEAKGWWDRQRNTFSIHGHLMEQADWQAGRHASGELTLGAQGDWVIPPNRMQAGGNELIWSAVAIHGQLDWSPVFRLKMDVSSPWTTYGPWKLDEPSVTLEAQATQATLTASAAVRWKDQTVDAQCQRLSLEARWQRLGEQDVLSGFLKLDGGHLALGKQLAIEHLAAEIPWRYLLSAGGTDAMADSIPSQGLGGVELRGISLLESDGQTIAMKFPDIAGTARVDQGLLHLKMSSDAASGPQFQAQVDLDVSRPWAIQGQEQVGSREVQMGRERRGAGVHVSLLNLAIDDPTWLERVIPAARGAALTGQFQADFVGEFQQGRFRPWLTLTAKDVAISSKEYDMEIHGLETSVNIDSFSPVSTPPSQWITAKTARMGKFELADGLVQFTMQAPDSYHIERTHWCLGREGQFWIHSFWLDPLADRIELEVFLQEMDLSDWLAFFSDKVHGQGRMYGRLPVVILPGQTRPVRIGQGFLYANPEGGFVQIADEQTAQSLMENVTDLPQQVQQRAIQALQDFQYRWLKLEMIPRGADTAVRIVASGQGRQGTEETPAVQIGRLEVNIHGFNQAINKLLLVKRSSDQLFKFPLAPKPLPASPQQVK